MTPAEIMRAALERIAASDGSGAGVARVALAEADRLAASRPERWGIWVQLQGGGHFWDAGMAGTKEAVVPSPDCSTCPAPSGEDEPAKVLDEVGARR